MLLSKEVKLKWNSKIKKHYEDLGYIYTKMKDEFVVKVEHLTSGSLILVDVKCDYCNKIYQKQWRNYILENQKSNIHKDSCSKCKSLKAKESNQKKYGCDNVFQLDDVKDKIKNTSLEKYGVSNPSKSELIKEKIKQINLDKYGFESYIQTDECKSLRKQKCMELYGIPYSPYLLITHQRGSLNPQWKGGAERNGLYRQSIEYKDWRKSVFEKDNYTCQCCSVKGSNRNIKLHAHHIYNYAKYEDLRFDIENGICLCKECHYEFHKLYSFNDTNKEQLDEFLLNHGKKVC